MAARLEGTLGEQEIHCSFSDMLWDSSREHAYFSVRSTQHKYFFMRRVILFCPPKLMEFY